MKEPLVLDVDRCLQTLDRFSAVIDARSPSEYTADHLPGAINLAVLNDEERAAVGTQYKQVSSFHAKRRGAALVARNIARILDEELAHVDRDWAPLLYCWRGGNRSGSLATILARVGWRTTVLEGGYREYRRRVVADLESVPQELPFIVVAGRTGAGKSLVLHELARSGAQVLDLEALAAHRGSVLGLPPGMRQPTQKRFESRLWDALRKLDRSRPVFVESESKKVGQCHVPEALIEAIRAAPCVLVEADDAVRVRLLIEEYRHFTEDPDALCRQLDCLVALHGHETIGQWRGLAGAADWATLVQSLLERHYDPAYDRSMKRNFARLADAPRFMLTDFSPEAIASLATQLRAHARRLYPALQGPLDPGPSPTTTLTTRA
jgi:tRNA 2-selenouridine synthase